MINNIFFKTIFDFDKDHYSDRCAVIDQNGSITYGMLAARTNQLANILIKNGIRKGDLIPIFADRSINTIIAIIGVLKTGAAYIPFETTSINAEIHNKLNSINCQLIIVTSQDTHLDLQKYKSISVDRIKTYNQNLDIHLKMNQEDIIYMIFTSGSTGTPKGVEVSYENVNHYVVSIQKQLEIIKPLNYAYLNTFEADLGNTSLFLSLLTKGTLHIIDNYTKRDPKSFLNYLVQNKIDFIKITPSYCKALFSTCSKSFNISLLKFLVLGGEKLHTDFVQSIFSYNLTEIIVNHYGPTETTIGVSLYVIKNLDLIPSGSKYIPIGYPIGNTDLLLINNKGDITEDTGELIIGGPQVSRGYYKNHRLTNKYFINLPGTKYLRYYHTGDICSKNSLGYLEFLGRNDNMVKIKGYRVEPTAVESVLTKHNKIKFATVISIENENGIHLLAGISLKEVSNHSKDLSQIKVFLSQQLPEYMVPKYFVVLNEIPLTKNGKIDKEQIKNQLIMENIDSDNKKNHLKPVICTLSLNILSIWKKFIKYKLIDMDDNFFELGGTSIDAIQVISELQIKGIPVSAQIFLDNPTINSLVNRLQTNTNKYNNIIKQLNLGSYELSPIQQWFFEKNFKEYNHWNQSVLLDINSVVDNILLKYAVDKLVFSHPLLKTSFIYTGNNWIARPLNIKPDNNFTFDEYHNLTTKEYEKKIKNISRRINKEINIEQGIVFRAHLFSFPNQVSKLLIVCHHLVIDGISWRIIINDLISIYRTLYFKQRLSFPIDQGSFWAWTNILKEKASSFNWSKDISYWTKIHKYYLLDKYIQNNQENKENDAKSIWIIFDQLQTEQLIDKLTKFDGIPIQNIILATFLYYLKKILNLQSLLVDIEDHGREVIDNEIEVSRTVGWLTSMFPINLFWVESTTLPEAIKIVHNELKKITKRGIGYGLLRYYSKSNQYIEWPQARICYNYLGNFDFPYDEVLNISPSPDYTSEARGKNNCRIHEFKFTVKNFNKQMALELSFNQLLFPTTFAKKCMNNLKESLCKLVDLNTLYKPIISIENNNGIGLLTYFPKYSKKRTQPIKSTDVILFTGGTGFIGIYVLKELLEQPINRIVCLVRAKTHTTALERIIQQFKFYFPLLSEKIITKKIEVLKADLLKPYFGLEKERYDNLCLEVDTIFHCAAKVKLFGTFEEIYNSNIISAQNIITFASKTRMKTIHHLSTLSVAGVNPNKEKKIFYEHDLDYGQDFLNYYEQSKFQIEKLINNFKFVGGQTYIYRFGNVSADSKNGYFQKNGLDNRFIQTIRGMVATRLAPNFIEENIILSQVDVVAKGIVAIAFSSLTTGGVFHVESPHLITHNELTDILIKLGFKLKVVSKDVYERKLEELGRLKYNKVITVANLWAKREKRNILFNNSSTYRLLNKLDINFPKPDYTWFQQFIAFSKRHGFLK